MKQFNASDSLGALIPISPSREGKSRKMTEVYSREFQAMLDSLDEEDGREESGGAAEKKRRLSTDQVKALERNFAVENKLEPERKVKLAEELGLQPRQVAIWFQNRRARWKTKQLERDYGVLKSDYDSLKLNFTDLERENKALTTELTKLKRKLQDQNTDTSHSDKESPTSESETNLSDQSKNLNHNLCDIGNKQFKGHADSKDGLSDSDSNAIIKEDSNANAPILISPPFSSSPYHFKWPQIMSKAYQCQFVKVEEQSLFSTEESCNFFSVDQAPSLHWYFPEQ